MSGAEPSDCDPFAQIIPLTRDDGYPWPPSPPIEEQEKAASRDRPRTSPIPTFSPTPFQLRNPAEIPPRQPIYGGHLFRQFVSLTIGPGGLGKSSLLTVEQIAMATGLPILGVAPPRPMRVWAWNGEDPTEELERRISAACLHHGISASDLSDRLMIDSGRQMPIQIGGLVGSQIVVAKPVGDALIQTIRDHQIDVLVIDPFVSTHAVPEMNEGYQAVLSEWRRIADVTGCAIELVHHTSKAGAIEGDALGVYASRGGGALIDGVRSARFLVRMTADEATRFGIEEEARHGYFRVQIGKANLAPPAKATWRRMVGQGLGNGSDLYPFGDTVGVCTAWTPPDAFEGMTIGDLARVQAAIDALPAPPRADERAAEWAGYIVSETLGFDVGRGLKKAERGPGQNAARAKVRALLSGWLKSGALIVETLHDTAEGRPTPVVRVGDPASSVEEQS